MLIALQDVVSLTGFVINTNQPTNNQFWAGDINQDRTLDILDIVSKEFGIETRRIQIKHDLNGKQRNSARNKICK